MKQYLPNLVGWLVAVTFSLALMASGKDYWWAVLIAVTLVAALDLYRRGPAGKAR